MLFKVEIKLNTRELCMCTALDLGTNPKIESGSVPLRSVASCPYYSAATLKGYFILLFTFSSKIHVEYIWQLLHQYLSHL